MSSNQINIFILTLFPDFFEAFKNLGVVGQFLQGKRLENNDVSVRFDVINIRNFALNKYAAVDDSPYGGGAGMVMRADILSRAVRVGVWEAFGLGKASDDLATIKSKLHIIIPTPRGSPWRHADAISTAKLSTQKNLLFVCGRYEGIDERFISLYGDACFSLGDFVLSGGEIAAMAMCDSFIRFIPGALGNPSSLHSESFNQDLLEYPQYTRPSIFEGIDVPKELLNGNHRDIELFQWKERMEKTKEVRPDLWLKFYSQFVPKNVLDDQPPS